MLSKIIFRHNLFYLISFVICLILVLYLISPSLNIFNQKLFDFHDDTQLTRIHEYVLNLKQGIYPPRLAPELSFNLGFPLYNFYAPFSYHTTGILAFLGINEVYALKLSFIFAILTSFITMFYFLRRFFTFFPSLLGGTLYVTSTYFAVEIIIRGNLAETWFLALFPLSLALIYKNSQSKKYLIFFLTTIILFFTLTVHNIFSLTFIPLSIIYILYFKRKSRNLISLSIALLLSSYFWLPVLLESQYTYALYLARDTKYQDHFLCLWQLWKSNGWNYGGSIPSCIGDQMSFQLGKAHIILGFLGLLTLIWQIFIKKNKKNRILFLSITSLTFSSLLLTLYESQFIWNIFDPVLSIFQFPWRFLVFGMFGIAFLGAYFLHTLKLPFKSILIIIMIISLFFIGRKYFGKPLYDPKTYADKYASNEYIRLDSSYKVREYLTKKADFNYWWSFNPEINPLTKIKGFYYKEPIETKGKYNNIQNTPFSKKIKINNKAEIKINIHYFPYWSIKLNDKKYIPTKFDPMGRPIIKIDKPTTLEVIYQQTLVENLGNYLSLFGFLVLIIFAFRPIPILRK